MFVSMLLLASLTLGQVDKGNSAQILNQHVDRFGMIDDDLVRKTGWQTLRGFRWRIVVVDDITRMTRTADATEIFDTGQAFKIEVESYSDLWIYVLNVEPSGKMVVLLPEESERHLLVTKGESVSVPPDGRFRFAGPPGAERFRIIAASNKLTWVNPRELLQLEVGKSLAPNIAELARQQEQHRTKAVTKITEQQAAVPSSNEVLAEVIGSLERSKELRAAYKDIRLMPPPGEDGQEVIHASSDRDNARPIVVELNLRHR